MAEGTRTVRIVTQDEALLASARGAVAALDGWTIAEPQSVEDLLSNPPDPGDVILLDAWLRAECAYESCRRLTGKAKARLFVITDDRNHFSEPIALFCGATGTLPRPLSGESLASSLDDSELRARQLPEDARGASGEHELPEALLRALTGDGGGRLIDALTDPETGLYSYDYLKFKLDEEFKRARRFDQALSCVMLGFDGQAEEGVLRDLAGIFLGASRDTDVLGRFDESSFLFLLPCTGPDGARVMGDRIRQVAEEQGLRDLVGDRLRIAVGISFTPHAKVEQREDLFSRAREAFLEAQNAGGVVVHGA
jgi:diguanylate cyclase (GGDEF)-like protein